MNFVSIRTSLVLTALVLTAAAAPTTAHATNLVLNPGFETGDFTDWTATAANDLFVGTGSGYAHSGTYGAQLGTVGSIGSLSQSIATSPGASYDVSFWFNEHSGPTNEFSASFAGDTFLSLTNYEPDGNGWEQFSQVITASSSSSLLSFTERQDPGYQGLDDISVVQVSAVPLPGGVGMLGSALLGLMGIAGARRKSARIEA